MEARKRETRVIIQSSRCFTNSRYLMKSEHAINGVGVKYTESLLSKVFLTSTSVDLKFFERSFVSRLNYATCRVSRARTNTRLGSFER